MKPKSMSFWLVTAMVALFIGSGGAAELMRVPGTVEGLVHHPAVGLSRALSFTFANGKIVRAEIITDRDRLQKLDLSVFND